jgi:hypothetical protein
MLDNKRWRVRVVECGMMQVLFSTRNMIPEGGLPDQVFQSILPWLKRFGNIAVYDRVPQDF